MAVDTVARALALASSSNSGDAAQIEESINTLQQNVSELENDVNTANRNIESLRTEIKQSTSTAIAGQGITNIVQLSQADYEALAEKDGSTLYIIMG